MGFGSDRNPDIGPPIFLTPAEQDEPAGGGGWMREGSPATTRTKWVFSSVSLCSLKPWSEGQEAEARPGRGGHEKPQSLAVGSGLQPRSGRTGWGFSRCGTPTHCHDGLL